MYEDMVRVIVSVVLRDFIEFVSSFAYLKPRHLSGRAFSPFANRMLDYAFFRGLLAQVAATATQTTGRLHAVFQNVPNFWHLWHCVSSFWVTVKFALRPTVYRPLIRLGAKPSKLMASDFLLVTKPCGHSPYLTSSLTRGCVCNLQFLLTLASGVKL
jgi:hypothetical protein